MSRLEGKIGVGRVPDVVVHMLEAHIGSHVVLDVQDSMNDVAGE